MSSPVRKCITLQTTYRINNALMKRTFTPQWRMIKHARDTHTSQAKVQPTPRKVVIKPPLLQPEATAHRPPRHDAPRGITADATQYHPPPDDVLRGERRRGDRPRPHGRNLAAGATIAGGWVAACERERRDAAVDVICETQGGFCCRCCHICFLGKEGRQAGIAGGCYRRRENNAVSCTVVALTEMIFTAPIG